MDAQRHPDQRCKHQWSVRILLSAQLREQRQREQTARGEGWVVTADPVARAHARRIGWAAWPPVSGRGRVPTGGHSPSRQEGIPVAVSPSPDTVTGRVVTVNAKDAKLAGQADWLNFSKYARDIVPPIMGQTVTVTLDRQHYVRTVDPIGGSQEPTTGHQAPTGQREPHRAPGRPQGRGRVRGRPDPGQARQRPDDRRVVGAASNRRSRRRPDRRPDPACHRRPGGLYLPAGAVQAKALV
jgi:hypothetical protein